MMELTCNSDDKCHSTWFTCISFLGITSSFLPLYFQSCGPIRLYRGATNFHPWWMRGGSKQQRQGFAATWWVHTSRRYCSSILLVKLLLHVNCITNIEPLKCIKCVVGRLVNQRLTPNIKLASTHTHREVLWELSVLSKNTTQCSWSSLNPDHSV